MGAEKGYPNDGFDKKVAEDRFKILNEAFVYQLPNDVERCSICDEPIIEHKGKCKYINK